MKQCSAIKPNGERCTLTVKGQQTLCWAHDPANSEKRRRTASRGGKGKPNRELADLKAKLEEVIEGVLDGTIERGRGAVAFQGFNTLVRAIELERKIKEQEELLERLEALERRQDFGRVPGRGGKPWSL